MRDSTRSHSHSAPLRALAAGLLGSLLLAANAGAPAAGAGAGPWAFNAIHGASRDFIVGVGDRGTIVQFVNGEPGLRVPSGTTNTLLDVYVAAPDFAVAAGIDVVLLWDGRRWSPVVTSDDGSAYRSVWASPERDAVVYGGERDGFDVVCPYLPGADLQPFCRRFASPMVGACGHSDEINVVLANGEIHRVNNAAIDPDGTFEPLSANSTALQLTDAWFPDPDCSDDAGLPEVFAAGRGDGLWHFDGRRWQSVAPPSRSERRDASTGP